MVGSTVNGGLEIIDNSYLFGPLHHKINKNDFRKKVSLDKEVNYMLI